ncbi:uncharacterized protein LOC132725597 [Ruditapes philippinarum]|uniref:uncharacterized protein LOC132725597 n=1 Tax=Ruditapes philippinarum TaxID=129788 RepID=UPI00295A99F8|nr:uncharacterized protein LOC132725597 [Ruditapes philippinarum]
MELLLYKFMLILAYSCTGLVRCEMIDKNFITEQVCFDSYGTVLETSDQVRGKIDCGSRCIKNNCTSFLYNQDLKLCTLNSEMFFNRTTLGCNNLVYYAEVTTQQPGNQPGPVVLCGEIPLLPSIMVNNASGNYSVGYKMPYNCSACASYPPNGSPEYIECGIDGVWIVPPVLCVTGADTGFLKDGTPVPANAIGCFHEFNNTCPEASVMDGYLYDGTYGSCFCDSSCCGAGDCCYDSTCASVPKPKP